MTDMKDIVSVIKEEEAFQQIGIKNGDEEVYLKIKKANEMNAHRGIEIERNMSIINLKGLQK